VTDARTDSSRRQMAEAVHDIPVLYDLVTSMLVPHIQVRAQRAMWPVEPIPENGPRVFRSDAQKVVAALGDVVQDPVSPHGARETRVYAWEYFFELAFQRFFAWAVHRSARREGRPSETSDFKYRNGAANARAVLAMPLLCDRFRTRLRLYIQQGNFGYMAARTDREPQWIYPHIDHYLDTIYHPWIPLAEITPTAKSDREKPVPDTPEWRVALERAECRSEAVASEIWELLRSGPSLWYRGPGRDAFTVREVRELFEDRPGNPVSAFVRQAVLASDMALCGLWTNRARDSAPITALLEALAPARHEPAENKSPKCAWVERLNREREALRAAGTALDRSLDEFFKAATGTEREPDRYTKSDGEELDYALFLTRTAMEKRESYDPKKYALQLTDPEVQARFRAFVRRRALEESLRLLSDRVLLERRLRDPASARPAEVSRLRERGAVVVVVPEIHLNMCLDEQLREPSTQLSCLTEKCDANGGHCQVARGGESAVAAEAREARQKACREWLAAARKDYTTDTDSRAHFWSDARYPFHVLFETLLTKDEQNPERLNETDHLMGRLLAFLVPVPPRAGQRAVPARDLPTTAEFAEKFRDWATKHRTEFAAAPLRRLGERLESVRDADLPRGRGQRAWRWLTDRLRDLFPDRDGRFAELTLEELWRADWGKVCGSAAVEDDRAENGHFFALGSFWSVNLNIFRSLGTFGATESLLNVRLLAPERTETEHGSDRAVNDFADFIGTFAWDRAANSFWTDPEALWVADILRLKLLVRILGTSLVNVERSRTWRNLGQDTEKERLRDLVRNLLHGYQKTATNFPVMNELIAKMDDPTERRRWGAFVRFMQEGHVARIVSVDAGARRLTERSNADGFFNQCLRSVNDARAEWAKPGTKTISCPNQWRPFTVAFLHGCLIGCASRLLKSGLEDARKLTQNDQLSVLLDHLRASQPTRQLDTEMDQSAARGALQWLRDGAPHLRLPPVEVSGADRAARYHLVLPSSAQNADRLNTCWTLLFSEQMMNLLSDSVDGPNVVRKVVLTFEADPVRIVCDWITEGCRCPDRGPLCILRETKYVGSWVRPVRPTDESGGGWGHYGNVQFVEDVMCPAGDTDLPLPGTTDTRWEPLNEETSTRPRNEFRHRCPPQSYQVRWCPDPADPELGTLSTRLVLTAPSIDYRPSPPSAQ
jgi:hypothetical protein